MWSKHPVLFRDYVISLSVFMIIHMTSVNVVVWCDLSPGHEPILYCSGIVMLNVHQDTRSGTAAHYAPNLHQFKVVPICTS